MKLPLHACILFGLFFLSTMAVHAQSCPEGYEVTGGQGAYGCAPRPDNDSYNQQQQQQQTPQPSPPQWVSRWGAVATDSVKGTLGAVTGLASKSEAQQAAMADCQAKGGSRCKLENSYSNACVAMIVGDKSLRINSATTLDKAINLGMQPCAGESKNCHIYYSACSLPVRIQ